VFSVGTFSRRSQYPMLNRLIRASGCVEKSPLDRGKVALRTGT
jgi:hypothetical protein